MSALAQSKLARTSSPGFFVNGCRHVWSSLSRQKHISHTQARIHSNNTAEMSAIIEALSFLGPHGPVARDAHSCVFHDSKHAAGVCLGTILARTHVQLGLFYQQLLLKVQHRLRFTMQHVYSHVEDLETNVRIMLLHLVFLAWCRTKALAHVGRILHLIPTHAFATCHNRLGKVT